MCVNNDDTTQLIIDEVCRVFRMILREFGKNALDNATVISAYDIKSFSNINNTQAPTVSSPTLGCVDYKIARFFEDNLRY